MTKRNLTLGTASGRLGSVVYFRRRGQQIARVLVQRVNDRRSIAQCRQRARFANSVALWRLLRPYIGESWRGVSRYGSPENAFYHHNRGFMPTCSRNMSRSGYAFPCLGIVSYGSLSVDVPIIARPVNSESPSGGVLIFSILTRALVIEPTNATDLFNLIQSSSQGIEDTDKIHFLGMAYGASDYTQSAVSAAEQYAPKVYHAEITKSSPSLNLSVVAPWLRFEPARTDGRSPALGIDFDESWLPPSPDNGFADYVLALFIERPNNPPYSRFSRARFLGDEAVISTLNDLCENTAAADRFADTFRNV